MYDARSRNFVVVRVDCLFSTVFGMRLILRLWVHRRLYSGTCLPSDVSPSDSGLTFLIEFANSFKKFISLHFCCLIWLQVRQVLSRTSFGYERIKSDDMRIRGRGYYCVALSVALSDGVTMHFEGSFSQLPPYCLFVLVSLAQCPCAIAKWSLQLDAKKAAVALY